ncbi:MAG: Glycosyl transferase group 1 [Parcubacteria group bacterium GW2011_GWC1_42_11]|uniref:Glycosyl transferase group 1 n=1 Tax=Candidatus Nomurabacteria bacterium GW2011_GWC2_42_20 TaxID=1618756 RepID=A0A0G1BQ39_9BACT|nr:MAG: Glycosyl transferase group 1 [Parcubacteria group bacterium GW2011_GWC1_42_11]KKS48351.1 MAG: Glycosyl transferase group 1 [Candidatus Nomurabacteria bacterium GW2011_GWC2_42_20]KKS59019.1 MAG: Glycosyl transferase group 1 [Candidatus Nomurabacteria bacterium GW2011_GWA2_42_41]KKT09927.1 MAG: Glycosyl transferase group 1 [Candidatus Nomurabacteria bacterium GW2011_GWB1_43_20]TAN35575.1 MAG: glycosyltransferase [Patescibacteria group bacterium]
MKVAFIHNEKKIGTGAHYINDLMSSKLKGMGVEIKNFYPRTSFDAPMHLSGLKNILFFHSLIEKRNEILKFDLIQGTTYTPLPFLAYPIPVISHFGSTTNGFLNTTPLASQLEDGPRDVWYGLKKAKVIKELNIRTRRPLRDIAEIEELVAIKADAIIATSVNVKNELIAIGVDEEKIHMIHNAIEDYWFDNSNTKIVDEPQIVFLGRIGNDAFNLKLKGLDRLIHLYNQFKDVKKTTICMTTNKGVVSWLMDNIPNHSLFVNMKKDRIPETVKNLRGSILFLSSRYEGFSLSLIEGMSQGLVPVAYPVGVAPEIIRNGENGFLVSSQSEAVEKIKILLANPELRKKCVIEAEKTARNFSGSEITKKLIKLYEKIGRKRQ